MKKVKLTKKEMKNIHRLFPDKTDIVSDKFSYIRYIKDVNAYRNGILQGYLEDFPNIDLKYYFYGEGEQLLDNELPTPDSKYEMLLSKTGDLDIREYEEEIELLHKEFVSRILNNEDPIQVDADISQRMTELATRNQDGTHVITNQAKTRWHQFTFIYHSVKISVPIVISVKCIKKIYG